MHKTAPELQLLQGTRQDGSPVPSAKVSITGTPKPPADLKGEAFAEWCRVTAFLERMGLIEQVDHSALVVYCVSWALFDEARREVALHGTVIAGRDGGIVKNPAIQIMNDASKTMLSYGARFGITPKDRQNLGLVAPEDPSVLSH
jgi:P27 family predicted phage terminase small subunit